MIGAAVTICVIAIALYAALVVGWWILLRVDREGIDPRNHIRQMNREDGGPGPF